MVVGVTIAVILAEKHLRNLLSSLSGAFGGLTRYVTNFIFGMTAERAPLKDASHPFYFSEGRNGIPYGITSGR